MSEKLKRGDLYIEGRNLITVRRVAKDGSWADILVNQSSTGASWTKRQPLTEPRTAPAHFGRKVGVRV